MLSHKERTQRALTHQPIDRLPTQVNYTSRQADRMTAHFGVSAAELPARLDNHMIRVDINHVPREADGVMFDWWGAGFDTQEEGYFVRVNPLADQPDLDAYAWPDPHDPHLMDNAHSIITADEGKHFITPNLGWVLFERAWSLRGFAEFFVDMKRDPVYAAELLDRITDIQLQVIRRYIALGVDGAYFGDDYGAQENMLFSPAMWRQFIKPRLAQLFSPFREKGLPVMMHSDGHIQPILPDLVEIGLTTYNPVQPEVVDHQWLRQTFGDQLGYYGGISTQSVLPFGSAEEVRQATLACVRDLAPNGTGLLIAPSHRMMSDIPMTNVDALLDAFAELGGGV